MNNSKNSKALTIANALVRQGVSRSEAMRRAWRTVKQRVIHTNTAGVTRGNRQTLLYRLTRYSADDAVFNYGSIERREGFIDGFKLAVKLMGEVYAAPERGAADT